MLAVGTVAAACSASFKYCSSAASAGDQPGRSVKEGLPASFCHRQWAMLAIDDKLKLAGRAVSWSYLNQLLENLLQVHQLWSRVDLRAGVQPVLEGPAGESLQAEDWKLLM